MKMLALRPFALPLLLLGLCAGLLACGPSKAASAPKPAASLTADGAGSEPADAAAQPPEDATASDAPAPTDDADNPDLSDDSMVDVGPDLALAADAAPGPQQILFIGNSYTYVNDLPGMAVAFAAHALPPQSWQVTSVTLGGARLVDHLTQTDAVAQIQKGGATWVVLQGQSVEPAADQAGFLQGAKALATQVHKTKASLAFYSTWPRQAGDAVYAQGWSGGSQAALYAKLKDATQLAAEQNLAVRVPVADAWMAALAAHPEVSLYQADGSHPSVAGTYLAACVFARTLGGVDASTVTWKPTELPESAAVALRKVCLQF